MIRVRAEILNSRRTGAYHSITVVAPEIADVARPGQFISVGVPADRAGLLRQPFTIAQASKRGGWAGTLEFALDARDPAVAWLATAKAHSSIDVIGPLGRPFAFPAKLTNCLLVSEGLGSAAMYFLAQELRTAGKRVDMVIGAPTQEEIFKIIEGKRLSSTVTVVTGDGSAGERGAVRDVLPAAYGDAGAEVLYAAGPRHLLLDVARFCAAHRVPAQVSVDEAKGCGTGLCFTCVVPVATRDGMGFEHLRACTEGPVFNPARILWDRWLAPDELAEPSSEPEPES
ncbi:MAG: dihydroorotate dehydrogenase electron transfer subunit [Actinomycetota bacterium]